MKEIDDQDRPRDRPFGPTELVLDAFRAFPIPDSMCEEFGYPEDHPRGKRKILAGNAAPLYGVDLDALAVAAASDDLSWTQRVAEQWGRTTG